MGPAQAAANARTGAGLARSRLPDLGLPDISVAAALPLSMFVRRGRRGPSSARAVAAARPMPLLAPVTITVRPVMLG